MMAYGFRSSASTLLTEESSPPDARHAECLANTFQKRACARGNAGCWPRESFRVPEGLFLAHLDSIPSKSPLPKRLNNIHQLAYFTHSPDREHIMQAWADCVDRSRQRNGTNRLSV